MKVRRDVPNLRTERSMKVVRRAFASLRTRAGFRLVHFSVQGNHLHLLVEADENRMLSRGLQALAIRIAKNLNALVGRVGSVFADRYHARGLATPREVRNALAYVLLNRQRHAGRRVDFGRCNVDPYSSAASFDGWIEGFRPESELRERLTVLPRSWLLARGWRRRGRLDPCEIPGP